MLSTFSDMKLLNVKRKKIEISEKKSIQKVWTRRNEKEARFSVQSVLNKNPSLELLGFLSFAAVFSRPDLKFSFAGRP